MTYRGVKKSGGEYKINKANLKETSLYELAIKAKLDNPRIFVKKFIDYDRRIRSI